jgi:hypothetical protein
MFIVLHEFNDSFAKIFHNILCFILFSSKLLELLEAYLFFFEHLVVASFFRSKTLTFGPMFGLSNGFGLRISEPSSILIF